MMDSDKDGMTPFGALFGVTVEQAKRELRELEQQTREELMEHRLEQHRRRWEKRCRRQLGLRPAEDSSPT